VYAFVEVKSLLNGEEIEKFTKAVRTVRDLASEKRYVVYGERDDGKGHKVVAEGQVASNLPPRSFLIAINSDYANIDNVEAALKKYTEINGAHIHGVAVLENDWFIAQQATFGKPSEFALKDGGALATFCVGVLACIQSMNMAPASMSRYFDPT
jgi:hypothetical protein